MTWKMNVRDERMAGREEGIEIGREEGIEIGTLDTIVSFVVRHVVPYEIGLEESGLSDEEFYAKVLEVDPDFQK
jgi:hypothetical protein